MRIELPLPSWADTTPRVDDDAHTLTVATAPLEWTPWQWGSDPAPTLRLQVEAAAPLTVTLTF
jgi:hypothetical protein